MDIEKENVKALKYIDIVRTRNFDVEELLTSELSKEPRYLTKEKASAGTSQLAGAIKEHLGEPTIKEVPINEFRSCVLFNFMAYEGRCQSKLITNSVSDILQNTFGIHLLDYQKTQKGLMFLICI